MVATGKQKAAKPNTSREAAATRATFEQLVFLAVAELARSDANGPKPITEDRIIERFAELSTLAGKKLPKNYQSKARKLLEKLKRRELSVPHQLPSGPAHALSPLGRRIDLALRRRPQVKRAEDETKRLEKYCNLQSSYTGPWEKVNGDCAKFTMLELVQIIQALRGSSPMKLGNAWPMAYASDDEDEDDQMEGYGSRRGPSAQKARSRNSTPRPIPALTDLLQQASANPSQEYPSPPPTSERPRATDSPTTPRPLETPQIWRMRSADIPDSSSPVIGSSPGPSRFYDSAGPSNAILFNTPDGEPFPRTQVASQNSLFKSLSQGTASSYGGVSELFQDVDKEHLTALEARDAEVCQLRAELTTTRARRDNYQEQLNEGRIALQRCQQSIHSTEQRLQDLNSDRTRNADSLKILRRELERVRLTRERQQRQRALQTEETRLRHEFQRVSSDLVKIRTEAQKYATEVEQLESLLARSEEEVAEATEKLQSIYEDTNKSLNKEKTSRDMAQWRLEVERRQAEALHNKDRTLAVTQAALRASQKKQEELEEQVRKRDKWINVLEGWISSAFGFMNGIRDQLYTHPDRPS